MRQRFEIVVKTMERKSIQKYNGTYDEINWRSRQSRAKPVLIVSHYIRGPHMRRFLYFIEQLCVYKLNNCESDWSISSMDINNNNNNCKSEKERNILYLLVPNEEWMNLDYRHTNDASQFCAEEEKENIFRIHRR